MTRISLAVFATLALTILGCHDRDAAPVEDCAVAGDEDGNGLSDCADPACATACAHECGNGAVEYSEACDDGNPTEGDGCDSNCSVSACGNGIPAGDETCDDGNASEGDGCDSNCTPTACGNGIPAGDEMCDDGNSTNGDGCDSNCTFTACGNGVPTTGENCDDGNWNDGDGCDSNCSVTACGNGISTTGEACDDGNVTNGDGCDNNCTATSCGNGISTAGEVCDDGNATNGDGCDNNCTATSCGNGIPAGDEICDDGNSTNGDGCDSNCTFTACGNGVVSGTEECDDANPDYLDGCSPICRLEPLEIEPNEDGSPSLGGTGVNGNDFGTAFPDSNGAFTGAVIIRAALTPAGDEDVFVFTNTGAGLVAARFDTWNLALGLGVPCGAAPTSVDTVLQVRNASGTPLALNDDRRGTSDRCSSVTVGILPGESVYVHVVEFGDNTVVPGYVLQASYEPVVCGNAWVEPGETCEDGNTVSGDGCSSLCTIEPVAEVELNGTFADASANVVQITGDRTVQGAIAPSGDLDTYRLTVTTPTVVRFETVTSLFDCQTTTIDVGLYDSAGTFITGDPAGSGIGSCGALVIPLDTGSYFIRVEERGNDATIPNYFLDTAYEQSRGTESEPPGTTGANDTIATAEVSLIDGNDVSVGGDHTSMDDVDVFAITVPAGGRIRAETVEGNRAVETCESDGVDTRLTLFDQGGVQLVDDDDHGRGFCSKIDGTGTSPVHPAARNATGSPQTYYLMVRRSDFAAGSQQTFTYRLQVTIR